MNNAELWKLRETALPRGLSTLHPIFTARASNAEQWDVEGRRYIDFASGIAVLNTGHVHPAVRAAVSQQLDLFTHTCFQVTPYEVYVRLADRLNRLAPGPTPKKTILLTTGAEAIENAVKIARAHTRRPDVISFGGAFHGRTFFAMAMTGKVAPYKAGFGPFPGGVHHVPFPIAYHRTTVADSLRALDELFHADVAPEQVAAIVIEPVQGEGGFYPAPVELLRELRALCDRHGIVLVADEIQTGFGRTGKMFAVEHAGIEPDLMTLAKSLAGGLPLAAVCGKAEIMDAPAPGGLGGTYAGSPLACAAALAAIDVIEGEGLCARADAIGAAIRSCLGTLRDQRGLRAIGDVRGLGAMVAAELVVDGDPARPNADLTRAVLEEARTRGLILLSCGVRGNVIRFLAPLTTPDPILREGLDILETVLLDLAGS